MSQSLISLLILCAIIILFATRLIPIGITAVLGAVAMAVCGIITFEDVFSSFGNDTVMLILGMIVVGNAISDTGLTDVIGNKIMRLPGVAKSERVFLVVIITIVALLSGFLSNTATVAIFLPLIASVVKASNNKITKKNTYMAVGIASVSSLLFG